MVDDDRPTASPVASPPEQGDSFGGLRPGTQVGKYEIVEILGHGGFGITYRARDTQLHREVAIKEYLPTGFAMRRGDALVLPRSTRTAEDFLWGRSRFLEEARTLARLETAPGVVTVHDFLEANGTAYMVMMLVPGETLETRLKRERRLPQPAIEQLLYPLLDGLERVHDAGFLHRDIKPANILLDASGRPTLIDFGASRVAPQGRTQAMTAIYTPGYAAFEQFTSARQGPWTDIYALAGTLYHCVTGGTAPGALDRVDEDALVPASEAGKGRYAPSLLAAIDAGLKLKAADRPQAIAEWRRVLSGIGAKPGDSLGPATRDMSEPKTRRVSATLADAPAPPRRAAALAWTLATVVALALAGGGAWLAWRPPAETPAEALRRIEEDARRQTELASKLRQEEEARQRAAAEAARQAEQAAARKATEEKAATEAAARRQSEEAERRRAAAEAARRQAEEEASRKAAEEKAATEAVARRREEEEAAARAAAEAARRRAEEQARTETEAARRRAEEQARVEAEARRKAETEAAARKAAEEKAVAEAAAHRKAEEEARARAEAEAVRRAQEERRAAEEKARADAAASEREAAAARAKAEANARRAEEEKARVESDAKRQAEAAEAALRLSDQDRKRAQVGLTALGHDTRGTDGTFGPRTRLMIAAWQKSRGHPETGFLTGPQIAVLRQQAAMAIGRYDEDQKKQEDDKRKAEDDAKRRQEDEARRSAELRERQQPGQQAATGPSPVVAGSLLDGRYSGNFCYNIRNYCMTVTVTVSGGNVSGRWESSRGQNVVHTVSGTVSSTGELRIGVEWHGTSIRGWAPLRGAIVDGRLRASGAYQDTGQPASIDLAKTR